MNQTVFETNLHGLKRIHRGKVRDIYAVDDEHMLIVTTDRLSAFDVVLPDPIPEKGRVLTQISNFWFERTGHIVPIHLSDYHDERYVHDAHERRMLRNRAVVVRRLQALPVEAVVRGYLIGSGWKDYQATGEICGVPLPKGLRQADRLPEPIFTPATKAAVGEHDENAGGGHPAHQREVPRGAATVDRRLTSTGREPHARPASSRAPPTAARAHAARARRRSAPRARAAG